MVREGNRSRGPAGCHWVPSRGTPPASVRRVGFKAGSVGILEIALLWIGGPVALGHGLLFEPRAGNYIDVVVVWMVMLGTPAFAGVGLLAARLRTVGVGDEGVRVRFWIGSRGTPWDRLAPSLRNGVAPPGAWASLLDLHPTPPGPGSGVGGRWRSRGSIGRPF